ncbi:MAG: glycosyltransferase, partial [Chloroflexi bacterium]|nr:glycosyltransferase [Chloroflexota bacterium]
MTKVTWNSMHNILLISNDVIGERMAGPGIRSWEFAKALSHDFQVSLAVPNRDHPAGDGFVVSSYAQGEGRLRELASIADVIVFQGFILHSYPFLTELSVPLVVDVYDPFVLENMQIHSHETMYERERIHGSDLAVLNSQLQEGDFFLCASEKQRDFWLGMLLALNRVNPYTYDSDETLRTLIDVVPFGLPSSPPEHTRQVLKGVYKTIGQDDRVILWGGGIWDWFDPCTLIKAMANIAAQRHDVKLFFMGIKHPNPLIPRMQATSQAIQLSQDLGLYDKFVFFNEWVPYEERQNYLLEADVGTSLHLDHLETRFSFRTRLLDYIWAGLPIVTTRGDSMSELVEQHNLGKVVGYRDVKQVADTLMELLDTPNLREVYRPGFEEVRGQCTWERAVEPLAGFCANPRLAPDKAAPGIRDLFPYPGQSAVKPTPWWALPGRAWYILRR